MFRLVLIHQLVLSLLVGPMLCCCGAARLGRDAGTANAGEKAPRKTCCGAEQKSPDGGPKVPGGDKKPGGPANCPCKESPAKVAAVPEAPSGAADVSTLLSAGTSHFDVPFTLDGPLNARRPSPPFDCRSSSVSTADLLFAHHNLRC